MFGAFAVAPRPESRSSTSCKRDFHWQWPWAECKQRSGALSRVAVGRVAKSRGEALAGETRSGTCTGHRPVRTRLQWYVDDGAARCQQQGRGRLRCNAVAHAAWLDGGVGVASGGFAGSSLGVSTPMGNADEGSSTIERGGPAGAHGFAAHGRFVGELIEYCVVGDVGVVELWWGFSGVRAAFSCALTLSHMWRSPLGISGMV